MTGIYKITNTITKDTYIGSSKNISKRWKEHSRRIKEPNSPEYNKPLYVAMREFGFDNFQLEIIEEIPEYDKEQLHSREQYWIEQLHPTYNCLKAYTGLNKSEYSKQYRKDNIEVLLKYGEAYRKQHREEAKKYAYEYNHRLCNYNGEIINLVSLAGRFRRAGITKAATEAKKYLIEE